MPDVTASDLDTPQNAGHVTVAALMMRSPFLNETVRMAWLRVFLRVLSVGFLAAFIPWITLILLNAPILAPGSVLAPWLRFQPYNPHYEVMLTAIHLTWAVMLWRASDSPAKHSLFIDFTMWANAAHGVVMLIVTPVAAHEKPRKSGPTSMRAACDHRFGFCSCFRFWACSASRLR